MSKEQADMSDAAAQSETEGAHDPDAAFSNGVVIVYDPLGDYYVVVRISGPAGHGCGSYWRGAVWHAGSLESCLEFLPKEPR